MYTLSQVPYNVLDINGTFPLSRNVPHIGGLSNSAKRDKPWGGRLGPHVCGSERTQRLYAAALSFGAKKGAGAAATSAKSLQARRRPSALSAFSPLTDLPSSRLSLTRETNDWNDSRRFLPPPLFVRCFVPTLSVVTPFSESSWFLLVC